MHRSQVRLHRQLGVTTAMGGVCIVAISLDCGAIRTAWIHVQYDPLLSLDARHAGRKRNALKNHLQAYSQTGKEHVAACGNMASHTGCLLELNRLISGKSC